MKMKFRKKEEKLARCVESPLPPADSFQPCVCNSLFDRGFPTYSSVQTDLAAAHVVSCVRACGVHINKPVWVSPFSPE